MTDPLEEYGEVLRRALHAEADEVMPAADGLERIRRRTAARPGYKYGWAWFTDSWARPVLAAGIAFVVALLVISAPPALQVIATGDQAPPAGHPRPSTTGTPTTGPVQVPPGPGRLPVPFIPSPTIQPTLTPGVTPCPGQAGTGTPAAHKAKATPRGGAKATPCPTVVVTPTPTVLPTTPVPTPTPSVAPVQPQATN